MVCSVSAIKSARSAADYYAQVDDYYREAGHAPTAWMGRGAEALGLRGEVTVEQAKALLEGKLPNGEKVGGEKHRPGWDVTFSPPKSVSVALYIHGDTRVLARQEEAVRAAVSYIEKEAAATRIREGGEVRTEATGNLVFATYRHDTNRDGGLQLHNHAVGMNVTQSADGRWRSVESKPIYRIQKEAGAVYLAALARGMEKDGWEIEKTIAGGEMSFELAAISKEERDLFSSRSKAIEAELAKMGKTRETATAKECEIAALNTRQDKQKIERADLLKEWQDRYAAAGFKTITPPQARQITEAEYQKRADDAVKSAVAQLSERDTRFTARHVAAVARQVGMGKIDDRDIEASISRAVASGALVERETRQFNVITGEKAEQAGYTSREAMKTERQMLAYARAAIGAVEPAMTKEQAEEAIRAQETKPGAYAFNQGQRDATHAVLAGTDRITLVQGFAGTAKTTSVLDAASAAFRAQGYEVIALAPMNSSKDTLGASIGAEGNTVASFINKKPEVSDKPRVYIVDEASMLSARDMEKLLARTQDSRLIMVGDVSQLGSVESGAAFRQLQADSGLQTQKLAEIVRQRNEELREAVYDAIRGDASAMLDKVEVRELATREERIQTIAEDYTSLSREEREKTIIIAPGRDDRREINDAVRWELKARGDLGESREYEVVDRVDMTKEEARRAESYAVGQRLQAGRDYQSLDLKKGEYAEVVAVDINRNKLTLETYDGLRYEIDPSKYTKFQANEPRRLEIAVGDRLANRENTDKMKNGTILHVEKVTDTHVHARDDAGRSHKLDMRDAHKLDHAYAQTGHESQGRTCDRVLVHGESTRTNLMTQQNAYVAISRAKESATIYTDNREKLAEQIGRETGQKETALKSGEKQDEKQADKQAERQQGEKGTKEADKEAGKEEGKEGGKEADKQADHQDAKEAGKEETKEDRKEAKCEPEMQEAKEADRQGEKEADKEKGKEEGKEAEPQPDNPDSKETDKEAGGSLEQEQTAADVPEHMPQPGDREPTSPGEKPDLRTDEERRRDGELAAAALRTKGEMPTPAKISKDIEKGKASWKFDSKGERYLSYTNGKVYHPELHGKVREVGLRQAKTLGLTQKKAVIVDKHLKVFGMDTGIKTGSRVVVSRDTMTQKAFGRDRDELKSRIQSKETSGVGKLWAKGQDKLLSATNAEGWRSASTQEAIRAKLASALQTRSMRSEARDRLEEKAKAAAKSTDRGFER